MNTCENYSTSSIRSLISESISISTQSNNQIQSYKQSFSFSQQKFKEILNNNNLNLNLQQKCLFIIIPTEIFIIICSHLTPWDLLSLLKTCHKFHDYLYSTISSTTQLIWKTSRLNTIFFPKIPPPSGLNEREYCCILMIEKGCQFCGRKGSRDVRIYWTFRVRSCWDCLMNRTICIESGNEIPEYASGLPFTKFRLNGMYGSEYMVFWADSIKRSKNEFDNLSKIERFEWLKNSKQKAKEIEIDTIYREELDQKLYDLTLYHKKCQIFLYYELLASESNSNGKLLYNRYLLDICPFLNEVMLLPNHLFAQIDYDRWKNKMLEEYRIIEMERRIIPKRYNQIKERLVYSPLYKRPAIYWIPYCPSYKSPPYHNNDARIPWDDKFLDKVLVPTIMKEAILCVKQAEDAVFVLKLIEDILCMRIKSVRDALMYELGDDKIFRCSLCNNLRLNNNLNYYIGNNSLTLLYNYTDVKRHLYLKHYNCYSEGCEDIYIELDIKTVRNFLKTCSNHWFWHGIYPYKLPDDLAIVLANRRLIWWN
ncbi:f-box domain contaning protein [Gigaspora margarita]|uniref:F-box domain contaning protein n=1 Tax=Gigaspora margarita TaxID=4874 RepID=A0A8H3WXD6_GIGMA|nr:f-box domain contaning protein [Gigaspora margarita]